MSFIFNMNAPWGKVVYKTWTPSPGPGPAPSLRTPCPFHFSFLTFIFSSCPYFMDCGSMNCGCADHRSQFLAAKTETCTVQQIDHVEDRYCIYTVPGVRNAVCTRMVYTTEQTKGSVDGWWQVGIGFRSSPRTRSIPCTRAVVAHTAGKLSLRECLTCMNHWYTSQEYSYSGNNVWM